MNKTITPTELNTLLNTGKEITLLDVRRKEDREKSPGVIGEAQWKDPTAVDQWKHTLSKQQDVVLYCVRGGPVSQSVQQQLVEAGINATYLEGGIEAFNKNL